MTIKERINLIKDELSAITISGSFPSCSAADRIFDKLTCIATNAKKRIEKGEIIEGFAIALKVFLKGKALCSKADTSSGAWMYTEQESLEAIDVAVSAVVNEDERAYIFAELLKAASKKETYENDGDFDLLKTATRLVTAKNNTLWLNKLSEVTTSHNQKEYSSWKNHNEIILMAEYFLYFVPNSYKSYLDEHLGIDSIRRRRIELALEQCEFDLAEKLTQEKYIKEQEYWQSDWAELLADIYKKSNLTEKLLVLFEELLFKRVVLRKYDAYKEIKGIYTNQGKWEEKYTQILERAKLENSSLYIKVLVEEKDWLLYIDALQASPQNIYKSGKKLIEDYPKQVYDLFHLAIMQDAESASNRKNYYWIAKHIKDLVKLGGIAEAESIRTELIKLYSKRPALIDELETARQGRRSHAWDR